MLVLMLTSVGLDFTFLSKTVFEGGFVNRVCLSGHGTLVSGDLVGLDEDGIGWDLHAFTDLHDISDKHIVLVDVHNCAIPDDGDSLALVGHLVELCELPLL